MEAHTARRGKTGSEDLSAPAVPGSTLDVERDDAEVTVAMAPASAAADSQLVSRVAALVNKAYAVAEAGIFGAGYRRTSEADMARCIRQGNLALACLGPAAGDNEGAGAARVNGAQVAGAQVVGAQVVGAQVIRAQVMGCVHVRRLSPALGELGPLALDAEHRGRGLGRRLVDFGERHCRRLGCTAVQLRLVAPTSFEHAFKMRLRAWYLRMGYRIVGFASFQHEQPALVPLLSGPVDFAIFERDITGLE